jgi:hypothetical protein
MAEDAVEVPKPFDEELARAKAQLEKEGLEPYDSMAAADQPDGVSIEIDSSAEDTANDAAGALAPSAPSLLRNFDGISDTGSYPPDPIIATGPEHIVVMVNRSWSIYSKNGTRLFGPRTFASWWSGEAGNPFDPWCFYDQHARRFVMLTVAMNDSRSVSEYLISVSDDSNPIGTWYNYRIRADSFGNTLNSTWADYPKIGYDDGFAVYITANMFIGSSFQYSQMRVIRKSQLYSGAAISWFDYRNFRNADGSLAFTMQPANALSRPGAMFFVNTESRLNGNAITLWRATKTWPPSVTRRATIPIGSYRNPPDAVQRGSSRRIDTGDSRLYNAYYRMNQIVTAFPEAYNWGGGTVSALRYVVFNPFSFARQLDIRYGANLRYYYYPAVVLDRSNNIGIVFNRSGSTEYGSARYTARLTTDSSTQSSAYLRAGSAPYVELDSIGRNRWGDYSGAALDPSTGCTWLYSEYARRTNSWGTRIGEVCLRGGPPPCILLSKFQRTTVRTNNTYYTDRSYRITSVPPQYVNLSMIRTPNDERLNNAASGYMRFEMTMTNAWVFVAFDSRASRVPNWLSTSNGWVDTGDRILTSLNSQPSMRVYRKRYSRGACVDLGGNYGPGSSTQNRSNYFVFYGRPAGCVLDTKFQTTSMVLNQTYYTDRSYRITGGIPSWMVGRRLIRTPNNERLDRAASGYLRFTTPVDWYVYVLFDSRAANKPDWLDRGGWTRRTDRIFTSLSSQPYLEVWRKRFPAGACVDLGGNFGPGSSGENRSNYVVVYGAP